MSRLVGRLLLYGALAVALGIVVGSACAPQPVALPSDPESPSSSAPRTATPSPSPATPGAACPRVSAGGAANQAQLTAVRVAHQPGFDRLVFEFGPSTAPGTFGMPAYTIEATNSLSGPSGQSVPIDGKALFGARFMNASTHNVNGSASYSGSLDLRPATPLIKEARLVEDFERVLVWGVGLDHLVCPKVSELANPYRVVLDFASAP